VITRLMLTRLMLTRLTLTGLTIMQLIFAGFLFGVEIVPGSLLSAEEFRPPPTPLTRREVWQAVKAELLQRGLAEAQLPRVDDIDLPMAPPALPGPGLRVASACWDERRGRTQFRLECGAPGECLPFLAYISDSVHDSVEANMGARARSCRLATGSHPALASRLATGTAPKATVRTGERATAIFISSHMRMTASVTCMERGQEGEIIRVRAPDGHIFRARILGPARLEALPQ
jgi:hypothetical protein